MAASQSLTCIGCPLSCPLELTVIDGEIREVTGNECKRGEAYARQEFTDPRRMLSTTIRCEAGLWPRLPVKTASAVPKAQVTAIAKIIHSLKIKAPVKLGQVILEDVAGTGVAVVATRSLPRAPTHAQR